MRAGIWLSISAAIVLALALCLMTCGPSFRWEGTWKGNLNLPIKPGENPGLIRSLGQVELYITHPTFKLKESGVPKEGSIRYEDGKALLKIESRFGTPMSREPKEVQDQNSEIVLTPRSDGNIDFYDPQGFFTKPITLERQPDPASK